MGVGYNRQMDWKLFGAVRARDVGLATALLAGGGDPNVRNEYDRQNDRRLLHLAAGSRCPEMARLLIRAGGDTNARSRDGKTPLEISLAENDLETALALLEGGADPEAPVSAAGGRGRGEDDLEREMDRLVSGLSGSHNSSPGGPVRLLHAEAARGHAEGVRILLEAGAGHHRGTLEGETPLHLASDNGHHAAARVLVSRGADPNIRDRSGRTPLHRASEGGGPAVVQLLISASADANARDLRGKTALWLAAVRGDTESARLLVEAGRSPGEPDEDGNTPMHMAALRDDADMVRLLLAAKAAPNTGNGDGLTPVHEAARSGGAEALRLVLQADGEVNRVADGGETPLHFAAVAGNTEAARLLLSSGANPNARSDRGWSPLQYAAKNSRSDCSRVLLAAGANVNARSDTGQTALHLAVSGPDHRDCLPLPSPLDRLRPNAGRKTAAGLPRKVSAAPGCLATVRLLLEAGASPGLVDEGGRTPAQLAAASNCFRDFSHRAPEPTIPIWLLGMLEGAAAK